MDQLRCSSVFLVFLVFGSFLCEHGASAWWPSSEEHSSEENSGSWEDSWEWKDKHNKNKFKCPQRDGVFPDIEDCAQYYICNKGKSKQQKCIRSLHFDKFTLKCLPKFIAECDDGKDKFRCPEFFGAFPHPEDCTKYYDCKFSSPTLKTCPTNKLFDIRERSCQPKRTVYCGSRLIPTDKFECPLFYGVFPHPEDCTKYYRCRKLKSTLNTCPKGQLFDNMFKKCEPEDEVFCGSRWRPTKEFTCPKSFGNFPHPKNCTKYYSCEFSFPTLKTCRKGKLFDSKKKDCERGKVNCGSRWKPTTPQPPRTTTLKPITSTERPSRTTARPKTTTTRPRRTTAQPTKTTIIELTTTTTIELSTTTTPELSTPGLSTLEPSTLRPSTPEPSTPGPSTTEPSATPVEELTTTTTEEPGTTIFEPTMTTTSEPSTTTTPEPSTSELSKTTVEELTTTTTPEPSTMTVEELTTTTTPEPSTPELSTTTVEELTKTTTPKPSTPEPTTMTVEELTKSTTAEPTTTVEHTTTTTVKPSTTTTTVAPTTTNELTTEQPRTKEEPTGPPEIDCVEDDLDCIIKETGEIPTWFKCPSALGSFAHPSSKKLFIICIRNKPRVKKCTENEVYSEEMKTCV